MRVLAHPRILIVTAAAASSLGAQTVASGAAAAAATAADAAAFAVPESPALSFLRATPARITRPSSGRSLGVSLINGIDAAGSVQQGFAFDVAPFIYAWSSSLGAYQRSRAAFVKSNVNLSLGATRSGGAAGGSEIALGVRTTLIDRGDPLRNESFTASVAARMGECAPRDGPGGAPPDTYSREASLACIKRKTDSLANAWSATHWNAARLGAGAATGVRFEESLVRRSRGMGAEVWSAYGHPLASWALGVVYASYRRHRATDDDAAYSAGAIGARALVGSARINGFVEGVTESRWNAGATVDRSARTWSAGLEFMTAPGIWLATGLGDAYATKKEPGQLVLFANIRWGVSQKARLAPGA